MLTKPRAPRSARGRLLSGAGAGGGEPVGVGTGRVSMMVPPKVRRSAMAAQGRGSVRVGPAGGGLVGGDGDAVLLLLLGQDLEEEFGAAAVDQEGAGNRSDGRRQVSLVQVIHRSIASPSRAAARRYFARSAQCAATQSASSPRSQMAVG